MFKSQNFCHIASNNRNQVKVGVFVYRTTDDLAIVLTSGYFNDRIIDINLHDLIIHEKIDNADATKIQRNLLCVTERSLENVGTTLVKSQWEEDIESVVESIQDDIETIQDDIETIQGDITDIKAKDIEQDGRLDDIESGVAYKATDFKTPITNTNKGITETEETALNDKIDLAANSGRMITDQGVWYAKMYAATVAPSAEDGTNYADFSQTDGQGNPVVVLYERQNGAWVQTQTIVPPADYDGYVPITSKIWDIAEQTGQQGGRILWNHQSKEFTPYPQIISFDNIEVTGDSTVVMPNNPSGQQIVNKDYVDAATSGSGYHPDILDWKWADHQLNDVQWLRADTFSWQDGSVYESAYLHLTEDISNAYAVPTFSTPTENTTLGSQAWRSIIYTGNQFVVFGWNKYISTSTDGTTWTTPINLATGYGGKGVAYGNNKFVALEGTGHVFTSTNATSWSGETYTNLATSDYAWGDIAYGANKFVALNSYGQISTSTDGTTWTTPTTNPELRYTITWNRLIYNGTKFVALSEDGHISTSIDGTTWTEKIRISTDDTLVWCALASDGVNYIALGKNGYISISTDCITWTTPTIEPNLGARSAWRGMAWDGTKFVALENFGFISSAYSAFKQETVAGTTILNYTAPDGHKICPASEESNVAAIYTATGVAWYYILDTVNQRFKLPRTKFGVTGLRDTVGKYVEAGLPNITGGTGSSLIRITGYNPTGALYGSSTTDSTWGGGSASTMRNLAFDASRSNSIYGNSTTVQPPATQMYLYFYVGSFTQTALENTAGINTELFNDKVDIGHDVIEFQAPTAANNYTWYRKYRDGWVEQGGYVSTAFPEMTVVSLVVAMADTHYNINAIAYYGTGNEDGVNVYIYNVTTSSIGISNKMYGGNKTINCYWQVSGMAA